MIYVVATVTVKVEHRADFLENARALISATLREPGCKSYDLNSSITEPNCFVFVERWETREALAAHMQTSHFANWQKVSAPFVDKVVLEIVHPAKVETL